MAVHRNSQLWKTNNSLKHAQFKSPEILLMLAYEYFDWCDKHTWYKREAVKSGQGTGKIICIPVVRPYSLGGLCIRLGCSRNFFNKFKQSCDAEFAEVIGRIENIIETQHFEGAILGMFNTSSSGQQNAGQKQNTEPSGKNNPLKIEVINTATKKELEALPEILKK
jgi:hypothetical protein